MSTLNTTNLKNESSVTNNIVLGADGSVDLDGGVLYVDAANNRVGVGTTSPSHKVAVRSSTDADLFHISSTASANNTSLRFGISGDVSIVHASGGSSGNLAFYTYGSERARIDSSGRLLVGTSSTSATCTAVISGRSDSATANPVLRLDVNNTSPSDGGALGNIVFGTSGQSSYDGGAYIAAFRDGGTWTNTSSHPTRLAFYTAADGASNPTERMRINSLGESYSFTNSGWAHFYSHAASPGTFDIFAIAHSATGIISGTVCFGIASNGNVKNTNNSYGAISDITLKESIIPASSQWSDIKGIEVVNYNFKEETGHQTHKQLGVIAQQVEAVSPGLVGTDADGLKSVNYSVLYMKAVKALQEAMERIEVLEAKVNALESNTP